MLPVIRYRPMIKYDQRTDLTRWRFLKTMVPLRYRRFSRTKLTGKRFSRRDLQWNMIS